MAKTGETDAKIADTAISLIGEAGFDETTVMSLTRNQYESAFMRAILYFSLAVGAATAVEIDLLVGFSGVGASQDVGSAIATGLILGALGATFAAIIAVIGSAIVTFTLGIGLTWLAAKLLRNIHDWRIYFRTHFAIGTIAALWPVVWCGWASFANESANQVGDQWLLILDLALIVLIAGGSTALAWHYVWRHPEKYADEPEIVEA